MASFTPPKSNNLFGSSDGASSSSSRGGDSRRIAGRDFASTSTSAAVSAASWFEDDDEALLTHLLQSDIYYDNDTNSESGDNLNAKFDRLLSRFEEDIEAGSGGGSLSSSSSGSNDAWWTNLMNVATNSGFTCTTSTNFSATATLSGSSSSSVSGGSTSFPKAFHTPDGKAHITALVDLLGISRERAVRMTLASLRTFAIVTTTTSTTTTSSDGGGAAEDGEDATTASTSAGIHSPSSSSTSQAQATAAEQEIRLRSLLGTQELFRRVLHFHRQEFLIRLRIITECLRLEQEGKADDNDHGDNDGEQQGGVDATKSRRGISHSCARLLDHLDARLVVAHGSNRTNHGHRRGIFQILLKLATGPALPGLGGIELPYSVGELRGSDSAAVGGGLETLLSGSTEILHAVRQEAAEALLVLLYDRIDGGVTRLDLFLIMEAASSLSLSSSSEFGMTGKEYVKLRRGGGGGGLQRWNSDGRGGRGNDLMGGGGMKLDVTMTGQQARRTLDGLWALICAECMGLWRTVYQGGNQWVNRHPFFGGIIDAGATDQNRMAAQEELEVLWQKLHSLGNAARDRRGAAYNECKRGKLERDRLIGVSGMNLDGEIDNYYDDDELWGVQAPEGVALLAFGLLLHLASLEHPTHEFMTEVGSWGRGCARMANDECAAFAYLHRVLESAVQDPIVGNSVRKRNNGNEALVSNLLKRGVFEMNHEQELTLLDAEGKICEDEHDGGTPSDDLVVADAASVICASIGREILTGTIRAFRDMLLSLHSHSSAVENIGMLSDLASVIYQNSSIMCEQFWASWEMFCQRDGSEDMDNVDDEEITGAEPVCYLLDASHSLATSTLAILKTGGSQQAIIHCLRPLSTFLHLIASLCASPSMVRSILTSEFLPEELLRSSMSVVSALAPLINSINESYGRVTAEERRTIRHATLVIHSISTLAYLGGEDAKEWIRKSLQSSVSSAPHIICKIASEVHSHRKLGLECECAELTSSALNLLADLLVGSDTAFQVEACNCFAPSSTLSFERGDKMSGLAPFIANGGDSEITLAAMTILNCLSANLARNAFNHSIVSSDTVPRYIETIGCGVMVALDLLSSFVLSSEVSFPTSRVQVATTEAILASIVGTLVNLKQVGYLHENEEVRRLALNVRNDIINALSSSTPLGQIVAFLATVTISISIMKNASKSRELFLVMDSAATKHRENEKDGKYGAWRRFVTPKRKPVALSNDVLGAVKEDVDLELYDVAAMALSLMLVWGEQTDDLAESPLDENRVKGSLYTLLLSKASSSSLHPHDAIASLNVANLNLISRLACNSDDIVRVKSNSAMLSARIIKMCLRHANFVDENGVGKYRTNVESNAFRVALEGGRHMFEVLLRILDRHASDDISEDNAKGIEHQVLLATIMLETVAGSVSSHPELARAFLLGGNGEDWRLVDKIVLCIASTNNIMNHSREDQGTWDDRLINLRCLLTCACLLVVSELWKSCRATCNMNNSDSVHACGIIVAYLTNLNKSVATSLVANHIAELTRCSLLAIMTLEEKHSLQELSTASVNQKCILFDLLSRSLDIIAIEIMCRVRTKSHGGIKFVEDLFDLGPMECWKALLTSGDADALAAASWLRFTRNVANWNIASFIRANPPEEGMASSSWCSFGSYVIITEAITLPRSESIKTFMHSNAIHALSQSTALFSASWATFFEIVTANVIDTRSNKEKYSLTNGLAECSLAALSSLTESKMVAAALLSSQGLIEIGGTEPFGELCTLLMYITARKDYISTDVAHRTSTQNVQDTIGRLYTVSNNLFVMTQLGSVLPPDQEVVCSIRAKLLTLALALFSEFESLSQGEISRDDALKYNDLRIGFTDLAVNALQSLQYVHSETGDIVVTDDTPLPPKYEYDFGATLSGAGASLQLLRVSLSLLSHLAPTTIGSNRGNSQLFSYGVDFAACLKERSAVDSLLRHLDAASTVSSLTYQSVRAGSSTHSVSIIHNNAVDIIHSIVTLFHSLTESGSSVVDVLLLLIENRCFRSLIDNPLVRTAAKIWTLNPSGEVTSSIARHRGYCTSMASSKYDLAASSSNMRPTSQNDLVHSIWREVINTFSSLLRSVQRQSNFYARVDEHVIRQLNPVISVAFDFLCIYEGELFSCFSSMLSEASTQTSYYSGKGKTKSSPFSSSIQSSTFAFTPNLLKEAADISSLFAELCTGDIKTSFSRQCSKIYEKVLSTSLDLTKITSSFLGSIANARELFVALSNISTDMEPTSMFDNPRLAEGIPNARHEAICNAHFAHSCCIIATNKDFANSHLATTKAAANPSRKDSSLEQSFQIHVNNLFIAEIEQVAGYCLFNSLSVLSDTHPAFGSFTYFSNEEASRFDVAAVITPGTTVAIHSGKQYQQRYLQSCTDTTQYARATSCDRSTRTISVVFLDSGVVDSHVPWSRIIGMEDTSKRQCIYAFRPSPKSIGEADIRGVPSLGHLILALKWCRHFGASQNMDKANALLLYLMKCVADRAAVLLCTEVLTHNELGDKTLRDDNTSRLINMQLLDLFETADAGSLGSKGLTSLLGEDTMANIRKNLKSQLEEARIEREEEQQLWEQNHVGWGNASLWGSSTKRQGRRSPFRAIRKSSSSSGDFAL